MKRDIDACETFQKAASNYGDADGVGKARCLERLIAYSIDSHGKFDSAATHARHLAEVYERQLEDENKAIESYQNAADWLSDRPR